MRPLFGSSVSGSSLVYFNPWDLQAWITWTHVSFPGRLLGVALFREIARKVIRDFKPFCWRHSQAAFAQRRSGVVMLLRSQKVILIDRIRGLVFHILRDNSGLERHLLENEVEASRILPKHTIPVLYAHTSEAPHFLVQPYVGYVLATWRELLPRFTKMLDALFTYYTHFGFREVDTSAYLDELTATCRKRLREMEGGEAREIERLLSGILEQCHRRIDKLAPCRTLLTRVHGDFISAHVVVAPREGIEDAFTLTDWCESHEYSVFHDLFYFHFQNYESGFVERILTFQPEDLRTYFESGAGFLEGRFRERWNHELNAEDLQLNFIVCFVQELEHRLCRLHGRELDFWASQTTRLLKRSP